MLDEKTGVDVQGLNASQGGSDGSSCTTFPVLEAETAKGEGEVPRDFFFIPVPKYLRHDPAKPAHFGLFLNCVFAVATTFSESLRLCRGDSLYGFGQLLQISTGVSLSSVSQWSYLHHNAAHPPAVELSLAFNVSYNEVSNVPTLMQAGYVPASKLARRPYKPFPQLRCRTSLDRPTR